MLIIPGGGSEALPIYPPIPRYIQQEFEDFLQCGRGAEFPLSVAISIGPLPGSVLFLDGVYAENDYGKQRFHRVKAPTHDELKTLVHTLSHRIATGPQQGREVFTLREDKADTSSRLANHAGFSLHAGVVAEANQRDKLERLSRYVCRPAVSEKRLAVTANGQVRYELKTPY